MPEFTLLIVDDDRHILQAMQRLFREENWRLLTAGSGAAALEVLHTESVHVMISDYQMPGMNGLELMQRTVVEYPDLIRILLTGHADLAMAIDAINQGSIYKFLLKPWNNEDMKITIRRALEHRMLQVENRSLTESVRRADALLQALEREHPGITKRPEDGVYRIE